QMSGANASPIGRSHQEMTGANARPVGRSHQGMKRVFVAILLVAFAASHALAAADAQMGFWDGIKATVQKHLGRPYVWGASGLKSFDCSGFVWRIMYENGVLLKRTTARKFYMSLPKANAEDQKSFGTLVFFDDLKH